MKKIIFHFVDNLATTFLSQKVFEELLKLKHLKLVLKITVIITSISKKKKRIMSIETNDFRDQMHSKNCKCSIKLCKIILFYRYYKIMKHPCQSFYLHSNFLDKMFCFSSTKLPSKK